MQVYGFLWSINGDRYKNNIVSAVLRRTAQHCAEPRRTALIDYMEINCSIHTESSAAQYSVTCCALFALGANRAAKCTARSVNGQRSAAPSCPHYARHVIHEY